jgi:hypothetical protein
MLIQHAIYVPAEDCFLVSAHRDIPNVYTFPDGQTLAISGALEWTHRDGDLIALEGRYEEWNLMDDWPFEDIAARLLFQRGDEWRPIKEATASELETLARGEGWTARVAAHWLTK